MSFAFTDESRREIDKILSRYPTKEAAILPTLYVAQRQLGHVSDEAIVHVAEVLGFTPARIEGVATFYTMYNRKPVGRYHVQVCRNIACSLLGAEHLIAYVSKKLGIRPGETTPDGKFTLSHAECLGSCGTAPVMQINDDYHENLTEAKIDAILGGLK